METNIKIKSNKNTMKNILITGGAGFIGSHVIRLFLNKYPDYNIYNLDKLTYAGNLENLREVENYKNYLFLKEDICDFERMKVLFNEYSIPGEQYSTRAILDITT